MTGFGEARHQDDRLAVTVEVRTLNNRHLKLSARISEPYGALEPELERLVRESVHRGTVQLSLRVDRPPRPEDYRLNLVALASYRDQLRSVQDDPSSPVDLSALLRLPGVVAEAATGESDPRDDWPVLARVVGEALEKLQASRAEEGRAMAAELRSLVDGIAEHLGRIAAHAPQAVAGYRARLEERLDAVLQERGIALEPRDLIREVAIFAERSDIAEEMTRLRAHLDQFGTVLDEPESVGRKLEFVVQEMGREANTLGSKAGDIAISRAVVEIKGRLEKIRELILNIE